MQHKNRIALVTGAGGGLGQAMVRALAADGVSIALHYRANRTHVEALAEELSGDGIATAIIQGDLSTSHGPGSVSADVERLLGPVDILVNNAGDWVEKPLLETTDEEWDRLLNLDLRGSYLLCRALAPGMATRGWGRIINISSIASLNYIPGEGLYGIAKAGINMLTKTLGVELARDGVTVNAVAPAWTLPHDEPYPALAANYPQCHAAPNGRPGHATEVAALIRFLASQAAAHITGQVLPIDGGLSALFWPRGVSDVPGLSMTENIHRGVLPEQQLQMVWPRQRMELPPIMRLPAGYGLRTCREGDEPNFFRLMEKAGFEGWNDDTLLFWMKKIVPRGWFFVIDSETGALAATSMALHHPAALHPYGGELGWVAGHPAHGGKGLGYTVCAAVTSRLLAGGYERIYLKTDDWRLPAIKTYLKLGYVPFLYASNMYARWQEVCKRLEWPFQPEGWPKAVTM